jgi:hypothetical protein
VSDSSENAQRGFRAAGGLVILGAALSGLFFLQPDVTVEMTRIEQDRGRLHSDEVVLATRGAIERERARLYSRHRAVAEGEVQSSFLRQLAIVARRHSVRIISVDAATMPIAPVQRRSEALEQLPLHMEMRGTYRALLASLDELSRITDGVRVETPSFHWEGTTLGASVPVFIIRAHVAAEEGAR